MKSEKALDLFKSQQDKILEALHREIKENPRFSQSNLDQHSNLLQLSQLFLKQLLSAVEGDALMEVSKERFEPVLGLWHHFIKDQVQGGFSTKETALLIFALKTTLQSFVKDNGSTDLVEIEKVLDVLGMLTFEMYSLENEKLISRQNQHIQFLQSKDATLKGDLIGKSPVMKQLYQAIGLVLENDLTVLLEGESGTGKDVIATVIHQNSKRGDKAFVAVNCGAIPKELIESELFGHEKGAFTGADNKRMGKFELADGGTLFLDEVGELPLDLQVKLLRVLQNKQIERVGGSQPIDVDVRIIAATNQRLKEQVDAKQFRLDLYYRLNVFPIHVPPLRERKEDIVDLAEFFIQKYAGELRLKVPSLTEDAIDYLLNHYWEGNVRELENVIQRGIVLSQGGLITSASLTLIPGQSSSGLGDAIPLLPASDSSQKSKDRILPLEEVEKQCIEEAIRIKDGNMLQAAKALKISRTTLYNKIQKYGILL